MKQKVWLKIRKQWLKDNPPNHQGYYICYLCGRWINQHEITVDHVIPRSRGIKYAENVDNLRPCCWACNSKKGSRIIDTESL